MNPAVSPNARLRQAKVTPALAFERFGFYAALVILVAVFAALSPAFLTFTNGINILQQTSTIGIMAIGETPRSQSRPAINWLAEAKKASRWYLIGSDYVWPWQSHRAVKKYVTETGGVVVSEEFVPVGEDNHEAHLARIRAAKPDVVLISLIGTDSVTFNRAFAECGLAATTLRLAGAIGGMALVYVAPPLFAIFARCAPQAVGAVAWAMMAIALAPMLRLYGRPLIGGFALPAIAAAYVAFTFDSALQNWRGRGGYWKGRFQAPMRETGRA